MNQTIEEIIRDQIIKYAKIAAEKYSLSIRTVFGSTNGYKPDYIGSCILLEIAIFP